MKPKVIRPSIRDTLLARKMIENGGKAKKAMQEVGGFSDRDLKNPGRVTKTQSFQQAMENLGFSDKFLLSALYSDIKAKPKNRFNELQLGFKLRGHLKETQQENKTLILMVSGESADRYKIREAE